MPLTRKQTETDENHQYGMIFHIPIYIMANQWTIEWKKFVTVSDKVVERKLNGEPYRYETLKHIRACLQCLNHGCCLNSKMNLALWTLNHEKR